jgi:hypothetical protein
MRLKITFTAFFSLFSFFLFAQKKEEKVFNYDKVDAYVKTIPISKTLLIDSLAAYLSMGANKPRDKARAIYDWVSSNIVYDYALVDSLNSPWASEEAIRMQNPEVILLTRKAVCQGYAELFKALADKIGLRAEIVVGATKDENGVVPRFGHAWNVVKIAAEWELIDATWGANKDGIINEKYFFTAPEDLIVDHLPFDPMWQLTANPLPLLTFQSSDDKTVKKLFTKSPKNEFVYKDTISRYFRLDTLMRLFKSSDRMLRFNSGDEYVTFEVGKANYYRFIQMTDRLNSKLGDAIANKNVEMDSSRFEGKLAAKWSYYQKALNCYAQIKDDIFQEKVKKGLFTSRQIDGLQKFDRGIYYVSVFNSKKETSAKTENGLNELEKYVDYSFKNLRSAINAFDTLAETKFRSKTEVALFYQVHDKAELVTENIVYLSDFVEDDDYTMKNKKKIRRLLSSCEQNYKDAFSLVARLEKLDTSSHFKEQFVQLRFLIDFITLQYDAKIEYLENMQQKEYELESLDKKEKFYNQINDRILALKKEIEKDIFAKQKGQFFQNIRAIEMMNNFSIAGNTLARCQMDTKLTAAQIKLYIANAEHYLDEAEKIFKSEKGQKENFYTTNKAFIASCRATITELKSGRK